MSKWKRVKTKFWRKTERRTMGLLVLTISKYAKVGDAPGWHWVVKIKGAVGDLAVGDDVRGKKNVRKCTEAVARILKNNHWPDKGIL